MKVTFARNFADVEEYFANSSVVYNLLVRFSHIVSELLSFLR